MKSVIPEYLLHPDNQEKVFLHNGKSRMSFIDKTLKSVANTITTMYVHSETGSANKAFYCINPLVKTFSFVLFIVAISFARNIHAQLSASLFIVIFYFVSGISYRFVYKKIIFLSIVFGLLIFLPASLNMITPGKIIFKIATFDRSYHFWIYTIPQTIGITDLGIRTVTLLFLRVLNSISLALLFVYSSSFSQIIKGLKVFFIPDTFLVILSLAYKYIFILSKTIEETYFALKSKLIGNIRNDKARKVISGRVFFLFKKSKKNYEQTYSAMISRGYTGQVKINKEKIIKLSDILFLIGAIAIGLFIAFI